MIQVFPDQHLGEQPCGRDALVDDLCAARAPGSAARSAGIPICRGYGARPEHAGRVIELLAHILADALERSSRSCIGYPRARDALPGAGTRAGSRDATRLPLRRWRDGLSPKRLDLEADGLEIRIDALIQQRALHGIELLAAPRVAPALEDRHLVRELVDLQLLVLELFIAASQLRFMCAELGIAFI